MVTYCPPAQIVDFSLTIQCNLEVLNLICAQQMLKCRKILAICDSTNFKVLVDCSVNDICYYFEILSNQWFATV